MRHGVDGIDKRRHRVGGLQVKRLTFGGERKRARGSFEQTYSEVLFEVPDLCADGGARSIDLACCRGESARANDSDESLKGVQVHLHLGRLAPNTLLVKINPKRLQADELAFPGSSLKHA